MNTTDWSRVVVGDDGRDGGGCALQAGLFLREHLGLEPLVVHSVNVPQLALTPGTPESLVSIRADLAGRAEAWLSRRVEEVFGSPVECRVELGRPATALNRAARSLPAEVIALGAHAKDGLLDFGGTQRRTFSGTDAHIWSQPTSDVKIERVVAPFDFDDKSEEAVAAAYQVARQLNVPLLVVHFSESIGFVDPIPAYAGDAGMPVYVVEAMHRATEARFFGWFKDFALDRDRVEARFDMGSASIGVAEIQGPHDLVVMGTRGHTGLAAAVMGGVTYSVVKARRGPVLALRL